MVRLIQQRLHDNSWKDISEILPKADTFNHRPKNSQESGKGNTLVFVVGGITRAEISALRFLRQQSSRDERKASESESGRKVAEKKGLQNLLVASNCIMTGNSMLKSLQMRAPKAGL